MPRTDNDSWDITQSVGSTALGVAAARAAETESKNPLINDPFARVFIDAAGEGMWSIYGDPKLLAKAVEIEPEVQQRLQLMVDFMATRTAYFDEFFLNAVDAGIRQVVILAAGLDARSWRLPWPEGTVVYELDQPKVLEFKSATLRQHGAHPKAQLVNVPIDLRNDWPTALQEAGFDASRPAVWSAEGLVRYLPAQAQDLLFERIHQLSAPGSWLASNVPGEGFTDPEPNSAPARGHAAYPRGGCQAGQRGDNRLRRPLVPGGAHTRRQLVARPRLGRVGGNLRGFDGSLWPQRSARVRRVNAANPLRIRAANGQLIDRIPSNRLKSRS